MLQVLRSFFACKARANLLLHAMTHAVCGSEAHQGWRHHPHHHHHHTGIVKINVTKNLYGEPVAAVGLAKQDRQIRAAQWSN